MQNNIHFIDYNQKLFIRFNHDGEHIVPKIGYIGDNKRAAKNIKKNLLSISKFKEENNKKLSLYIGKEKFATFSVDGKNINPDISEPIHYLTTFETCILGREKPNALIPFKRNIDMNYTPKTDVHSHFASCLPPETLIKIGLKHNIYVGKYFMDRIDINPDDFPQNENGEVLLANLIKNKAAFERLISELALPIDRQESFNKLEEVYRMRNLFSKNPALFPDTIREIGRDLAKHGIEYTELSLALSNDINTLKTIYEVVPEVEKETGCKIRFLAALWRHSDQEWNLDEIDRIKTIAQNPYIVGVDFMGHETNSTKRFADQIKDITKWATKNDSGFCIRIHAGENPIYQDNVKHAARFIKEAVHEARTEDGVKYRYPNIRIGHGLYGVDKETLNLVKEIKAIVEFNMSSNLLLNNIDNLDDIPLSEYTKKHVHFLLGTDGRGIYSTSPEQELILAHSDKVTDQDFLRMIIIENRIIHNDEISFSIKSNELSKKLQTMSFEDIFTARFTTPDSKPRFNDEVEKRYFGKKQMLLDFLSVKFKENGIESNPQKSIEAQNGKLPILITGASLNSWPNISEPNKQEIRETIQTMMSVLDPDKVCFITKGSNHGVEKEFYKAANKAQNKHHKKFTIIGFISDEAFYYQGGKIAPNTITHASVMTVNNNNRLAKNWLELADDVLWDIAKKEGEIIAIGGATLVRDIIQRGHNFGIGLNLMDGPEGASTERIKFFEGNNYSFKGTKGLIKRLHKKHPEIFIKDFDLSKLDEYIEQVNNQQKLPSKTSRKNYSK